MERRKLALSIQSATYRNHSVVPWLCHWPLFVDGSELCFFPRPKDVGFCNEQFEEYLK